MLHSPASAASDRLIGQRIDNQRQPLVRIRNVALRLMESVIEKLAGEDFLWMGRCL